MTQNPFPGPQPYRATDRDRFFGRDDLAYRLAASILANRCVTVYGPSGAGKSSLVQASVIPSLLDQQGARVVRVDGWPEDRDPTTWLADAVYAQLELGDRPGEVPAADALLAAARRAARRSPRLSIIYLDQLEQLLYPGRAAPAVAELFDCIDQLAELPFRNLRVVLSLREDYLGRFRDRLREQRRILEHGFRVGPLSVSELCEAVCQAAASGEPSQRWEPSSMRSLMLQVRVPGQAATDEAEAQAAFAQIVCRSLFQERAASGGASGSIDAEPIVRGYFEATLDALGELRGAAERLLEDHLVTADGSRTLRTEKELLRLIPEQTLSPVLKALEGAAILHAEEHQGTRYFELGHDWLARKVYEQRQQAAAEAALAKERRRRRNLKLALTGALVVAVVAIGLSALAYDAKHAAERERGAAESARADEQKARVEAEGERAEAYDARVLVGFRELALRGKLPWAIQLLLEVKKKGRPGWIELANEALHENPPLLTLSGHRAPLSDAVWSPDGARILTLSDDWTARIAHADGRGKVALLVGHKGPVLSGAFRPDGKQVVTASADGTARVWSTDGAGPAVALLGHTGPVVSASFSPDGAKVITASADGTARVFRADGSAEVTLRGHAGPLTQAIFDRSGAKVITASADRTVRLWNADGTGAPVELTRHRDEVLSLALSSDGARVLSTSRDGTAHIFSSGGKGATVELEGGGGVTCAAFSPDGLRVATASKDGTARLSSADGKGDPVIFEGQPGPIVSIAFAPDGNHLLTASEDRTARAWLLSGQGALLLQGHEGPLRSARWSPDGARVLTASADHTAKVWIVSARRAALGQRRGAGAAYAASVDAKSKRVALASADEIARVFSLDSTGAAPTVFPLQGSRIASAALDPDGVRLALALSDGTARVLGADPTAAPVVLRGHTASLRDVAFSPDGGRIATVAEDNTVRIWSAGGQARAVLRGHEDWPSSIGWSPDGTRLVTASLDGTARIWKAEGGDALRVLPHGGEVHTAAWSPDGKSIATASEDHLARIWTVEGKGPPVELHHDAGVIRLAWSPDSESLATASSDLSVRYFSADGKREPLVVHAQAQVISLSFWDENKMLLAAGADGAFRAWIVDPAMLEEQLASANTDCLPKEERELYLGEPDATAAERYQACERGRGHEPPALLAPPERSLKVLGPRGRRVKLTVLPADAQVEVDGRPVAREDGFIELTGMLKDTHRLHVWKGPLAFDWNVTIEESGAEPAQLDLNKAAVLRRPELPEIPERPGRPTPPRPVDEVLQRITKHR